MNTYLEFQNKKLFVLLSIPAKGCSKRCFISIRLSDLNLLETTFHVKLTEDDYLTKPIN